MKSKNSAYLSTSFPNELIAAIKQLSIEKGMTVPFLIRSAVVELLRNNGFDVSAIRNPKRRGERTDIVDDLSRAKLRKKAAYARSKIRRKRNGEPVDADVELSFKLAYEAMDDQRLRKKNQGEKP